MNMDSKPLITDEQYELLRIPSQHEAGHAVMRWIVGWPLTELTVGLDGGLCAGTGAMVEVQDSLMVTLAGIAVESGYGLADPDLAASQFADLDEARLMLSQTEWLRMQHDVPPNPVVGGCVPIFFQSVEDALNRYFKESCDALRPHDDLVEAVASQLEYKRRLSARTVAAICREYGKRGLREQTTLA